MRIFLQAATVCVWCYANRESYAATKITSIYLLFNMLVKNIISHKEF